MRRAATVCLLAFALASVATRANADPYALTIISAPGTSFEYAAGTTTVIGFNNAGQVLGYTNVYANGSFASNYFVETNGVFTPINGPAGVGGISANAINDAGQIARNYYNAGQYIPSRSVVDTDGVFTPLNIPAGAVPRGINNAGQVVGNYTRDGYTYNGFVYASGVFTTISVPGGYNTAVTGINNAG